MIQSKSVKENLAKIGEIRLEVDGLSTALIELTGTFVATLIFEYTINGEDWNTMTVNVFGLSSTATGATAVGKWLVNVAGIQQIRVRSTAYTSGTVEVAMRAVANGGSSNEAVSLSSLNTALGSTTDPASTATDTTPASAISIFKQISKVLQDVWDSGEHWLKVAIAPLVNTIDTITNYDATDAIMNGTTALTPKFAIIQEASSGNNAIVAAVASKKIRVLAYNFIAAGTVNAKFQQDGAGTPADLTGLKYCVANTGICAGFNKVGWFETAAGKSLDLNLSGAIAVGGELVYVEV